MSAAMDGGSGMSGFPVDELQSSRHQALPFLVGERIRFGTVAFRHSGAPRLLLCRRPFHICPVN